MCDIIYYIKKFFIDKKYGYWRNKVFSDAIKFNYGIEKYDKMAMQVIENHQEELKELERTREA